MALSREDDGLPCAELEPRLSFIFAENDRGEPGPKCRRPGCNEPVPGRTEKRGRTRWFHDDACSREFARRRSVLDAVIEEWFLRLEDPLLTTRERARVEWELRRVIGFRASYVGPTDWLQSVPEGADSATPAAARWYAAWQERARVSRRPDPCAVCNGTGDFGEFRPRMASDHPNKSLVRRAETQDAARGALAALIRLEAHPGLAENLSIAQSLHTLTRALREAMPDMAERLE